MKNIIKAAALSAAVLSATTVQAADYVIDTDGAHASIQFKIQHLGYSWVTGRFNTFDGEFSYDQNAPENTQVKVTIQTASVDSNHAERDKHLKSEDFLNAAEFPQATFTSTNFIPEGDASSALKGSLEGNLTLHGITKSISFPVTKVGEGNDPWGGFRAGFEGQTTLKLADYGITYDLGPASTDVQLNLFLEGVRK